MVGCHHRLNGHEFGWTLGVGEKKKKKKKKFILEDLIFEDKDDYTFCINMTFKNYE